MSFVFNGVIIPTDEANALTFNGSDVTRVFMDGVEVFIQSLFGATWSGSSDTIGALANQLMGFETSGSLHRWYYIDGNGLKSTPWCTVDSNGNFSEANGRTFYSSPTWYDYITGGTIGASIPANILAIIPASYKGSTKFASIKYGLDFGGNPFYNAGIAINFDLATKALTNTGSNGFWAMNGGVENNGSTNIACQMETSGNLMRAYTTFSGHIQPWGAWISLD